MASLLVRDVDAGTLAKLKAKATLHGRSLQAEALAILVAEAALSDPSAWLEQMRLFRNKVGRTDGPDSVELLRESRDER